MKNKEILNRQDLVRYITPHGENLVVRVTGNDGKFLIGEVISVTVFGAPPDENTHYFPGYRSNAWPSENQITHWRMERL